MGVTARRSGAGSAWRRGCAASRTAALALASVIANVGIVVTGGAVRLTELRARLPDLAVVHRRLADADPASRRSRRSSSSPTGS